MTKKVAGTLVAFKKWLGGVQIIGITVVESDRHRTLRAVFRRADPHEESARLRMAPHSRNIFSCSAKRSGVTPRVQGSDLRSAIR